MNLLYVIAVVLACSAFNFVRAQNYTSYFTGSPLDIPVQAEGGVCMMGGATEHDEAMRWFLRRANGGDVLVLRTDGADGYNDYLYSELGVPVNSVETIVCHNALSAGESYIHTKIRMAEAIWFAGGDQWDYVSYWRHTPIDSLINLGITNRNVVVGGTSAGMAILGGFYYTGQNGSVSSPVALNNPYDPLVTVDSTKFIDVRYMDDVVTDTHYDARAREGRHVVFMARILTDNARVPRGIACNEYTAVCIDTNGIATVYGDYPNYEEAAFFLQTNCELEDFRPEFCAPTMPLDWNLAGQAVRVCKVYGTNTGMYTFSVADWETSVGGEWENWYVSNGTLHQDDGVPVNCDSVFSAAEVVPAPRDVRLLQAYPNPFNASTTIHFELARAAQVTINVYDILGRSIAQLLSGPMSAGQHQLAWNCADCASGIYMVELQSGSNTLVSKIMLLR